MSQKGHVLLIVLLIAAAISGYLLYSGKINLNRSILQQITQLASTNTTTNWKTYTNEKFGYSIKYPPEWAVRIPQEFISNPSFIYFESVESCNIKDNLCSSVSIDVEYNKGNQNLEPPYSMNFEGPHPDKISNDRQFKFNNEDAYSFDYFNGRYGGLDYPGLLQFTLVTNHNGKKYTFIFDEFDFGGNPTTTSDKWKNRYIFDQMIASFKFTQ